MWISWLSRSEGCHTSCRWHGARFHVKPTSCGPAVTMTRAVMRASMIARASFMSLACTSWSLRPPICAEYTSAPSIVMTNVCGSVVALDAGVAFFDAADEPAEQLVLAVGREHVTDHACRRACRAAARRCARSG